MTRGGLGGPLRWRERTPEKDPVSPGGPGQPGARLGGRGVLVHRQRAPGKAPAWRGCPRQPRLPLRGWACRREPAVALRRQRPAYSNAEGGGDRILHVAVQIMAAVHIGYLGN